MKPTAEQLGDPRWWNENAPRGATHWCENGGNPGFWYNDRNKVPNIPRPNPAWLHKRPDHSVDATNMVGQKHDSGKPMMSLVPPDALLEVAKVITFGAQKYSIGNWQHVDDLHRRYTDAALRHINAYQRGEQIDDESNLRHLAHAICCLMFMLETDLNAATRD